MANTTRMILPLGICTLDKASIAPCNYVRTSFPHGSVVLLLILLVDLAGISARAAVPVHQLTGLWEGSGLTLRLLGEGNLLTGTLDTPDFTHTLQGTYDAVNEWSTLLVRRANLHNGCVTEMYGSIQLIDDQQITITTSTTDGKCELPVDFHTNIQLDKRDANLLTGAWLRPNILLHIRVSGALTRGELYTAGFTHTLSGTYDATTARSTLVVTRSNLRNGCVTELHGMIGILNPKQIAITITKTDGRCDLPTGFHDYSTYTREERPCASFQSTPCLSRGCVGRTRCDNSASPPVICSPQQEECNGLDDNCDGKIDENDICLASSACD